MNDTILYYIDVLATLCGFDGPDAQSLPGLMGVILAGIVLLYACFRAAMLTIWPGELERGHIKHRIFEDKEHGNAH